MKALTIHINNINQNEKNLSAAGNGDTVEVFEPSVIYEAKDGKYGEDGTVSLEIKS